MSEPTVNTMKEITHAMMHCIAMIPIIHLVPSSRRTDDIAATHGV